MNEEQEVEKSHAKYVCRRTGCGYGHDIPWRLRCPGCGGWYDCILNKKAVSAKSRVTIATAVQSTPKPRIKTGIPEFDKVLGGGLVRGFVTLLVGGKGTGKTTLCLQVADNIARGGRTALYASGEQLSSSIGATARRIGLNSNTVEIRGDDDSDGGSLYGIFAQIDEMKPKPSLLVVDSVSRLYLDSKFADPNAEHLIKFAQQYNIPVILICQQNKGGDAAGSEELQHNVDVVCVFSNEEDPYRINSTKGLRLLAVPDKNRDGETGIESYIEMTGDKGLQPLSDRLLLEVKKRVKFDQMIEQDEDDEDEDEEEDEDEDKPVNSRRARARARRGR